MKSFPLKLVAISICIICILSIGAVSALNQNEASVTTMWASPKYYQGDTASVRVIFQNNIDDELDITRVSIHFDWMALNDFFSVDLSPSPVHIAGKGSYAFELTNIPFRAGASAGLHSYYVSIDYMQNDLGGIWDSPSLTLQIFDGNEKIYNELAPQISAKINNATYSSTEAQSLLQQATTEYNNALTSAANGEWQDAVTSLRSASDYLDEAEVAEQQSGGQNTGSLLLYIAVVVIAVVIALSVIAVAVRRRSKKTELVEPAEPVEPVE